MSYNPPSSSSSAHQTLSDIKKDRKEYEQESILIQNRIKFLQLEEQKTWSQIKRTQKMKVILEEARKLKQEQKRKFTQAMCIFEKQRHDNHERILKLKENMQNNQLISRENLKRSKIQAYMEIRQLKGDYLERKLKNDQSIERENKKRSSSVKVEKIKMSIRKQQFHNMKINQFKDEYLKKLREELERKEKLQHQISDLETQETELIRKLQNTQSIHQRVQADFESMRNQSHFKFSALN